ncbi:hypothetical protein FSARC_9516 [Fusarium sarcochroum]|uniref:Mid2 domain-containing protein n=1 Tax=Fusarium sarcochroum TaxID=1208366 RepID=A0A8H4TQZ2_9HYPO|nr:hypothetical protein FSARC_9516 [Fusarium sarcochroum]
MPLAFYESTVVTVSRTDNTDPSVITISEVETTGGLTEADVRGQPTITVTVSPSSGSGSGGTSGTPVGAIVGGVVGGVALIALLGFVLWFIRIRKQKTVETPGDVPAEGHHPQPMSNYQQQPTNQISPPVMELAAENIKPPAPAELD